MESLLKKILSLYQITPIEVLDSSSGYRNTTFPVKTSDNRWINIIFYKREEGILERIVRTNYVSNYLATHGLPTRKTENYHGNEIIKLQDQYGAVQFVCLYNYLPGSTIPWDGYTSDHIKLLGGMMGRMHRELALMESMQLPDAISELKHTLQDMKKYFDSGPVTLAMQRKLGVVITKSVLDSCEVCIETLRKEPKQALHLDFVRGNILYTKDTELQISGVLDFEKTAFGPRVLDISRTLAFLIVDCKYKEESKVRQYFLRNGYQKRGALPLPDLNLLEELLNFFWMHDFYKFLRHNPYESLRDNEHFLRTKTILLKRNLIKTNG